MEQWIIEKQKVILLKPQTYMNLSGESIREYQGILTYITRRNNNNIWRHRYRKGKYKNKEKKVVRIT